MKLKYTRILSLVLCAAIACSALVGCGGSAASSGSEPSRSEEHTCELQSHSII